jgi:hypothetical protein
MPQLAVLGLLVREVTEVETQVAMAEAAEAVNLLLAHLDHSPEVVLAGAVCNG